MALLGGVTLGVWALLDFLHAEPHAPLALDGLFGWACYLLIGLGACALVARVQNGAAPTRSLLVPALAVAPFVLTIFWLATDVAWVAARPLTATVVALIYLSLLTVRVIGAAFGPLHFKAVALAVLLMIAAPWVKPPKQPTRNPRSTVRCW